jgi:hypothetical protein
VSLFPRVWLAGQPFPFLEQERASGVGRREEQGAANAGVSERTGLVRRDVSAAREQPLDRAGVRGLCQLSSAIIQF